MSNDDNKMARGLYYNEPRQGAPDYVVAALSFRRADFIAWLNQQSEDAKGYIKVDILRAKSSGKIYGKLNDWKPDASKTSPSGQGGQNGGRDASTRDEATNRVVSEFGGKDVPKDDVPF